MTLGVRYPSLLMNSFTQSMVFQQSQNSREGSCVGGLMIHISIWSPTYSLRSTTPNLRLPPSRNQKKCSAPQRCTAS
jgi:hypothetical protein